MSTRRRWTREETAQLIAQYEAAPALWDTTNPVYRDREQKSAALYSMASHFSASSLDITRKLHNLRCQMNNEIRKQRRRNLHPWRKGPYISTWEFYNSLKFINTEALQHSSEAVDSYVEVPQEEQHVAKTFKQELQDPQEMVVEVSSPPRAPAPRSRPSRRQRALVAPGCEPRRTDEHQAFGDFVASELRAARADAKRQLKRLIGKAVLQVCYDDDSAESDGVARQHLGYNSVPVYICSPVRCSDASDDEFS